MLFDEPRQEACEARHPATFNETTRRSNAVNRALSHMACDSRKHSPTRDSGSLVSQLDQNDRVPTHRV